MRLVLVLNMLSSLNKDIIIIIIIKAIAVKTSRPQPCSVVVASISINTTELSPSLPIRVVTSDLIKIILMLFDNGWTNIFALLNYPYPSVKSPA